jgi:hypothetical protein
MSLMQMMPTLSVPETYPSPPSLYTTTSHSARVSLVFEIRGLLREWVRPDWSRRMTWPAAQAQCLCPTERH